MQNKQPLAQRVTWCAARWDRAHTEDPAFCPSPGLVCVMPALDLNLDAYMCMYVLFCLFFYLFIESHSYWLSSFCFSPQGPRLLPLCLSEWPSLLFVPSTRRGRRSLWVAPGLGLETPAGRRAAGAASGGGSSGRTPARLGTLLSR